MKSTLIILTTFLLSVNTLLAQQRQRVIAECTVEFAVNTDDVKGIDNATLETFKSTSKTLYIKGYQSRVNFNSTSFSQSVIYNKRTGDAVILREIGGNKFLTKLDQLNHDISSDSRVSYGLSVADMVKFAKDLALHIAAVSP
ncbi:MAG TPA: hypothetical protein PLH33_10245, partial [Chitinophagaceae bacterium]|nr:hypothetical protein [Chitinophagaceae bacterium]